MRGYLAFLLGLVGAACSAQAVGNISGKVVDARSGHAVARCVVEINPTTQRAASLSVVTGEDGRFAFAGLGMGKYQLSASRRGYLTQSYQAHGIYSTAVAVGPGLQSEDLVFDLTPQAIVYGMISDEAGEAIRDAQVRLFVDRGMGGVPVMMAKQPAMTNDLGRYEIAEIAPGNYYLVVTARPWYANGGREMHFRQAAEAGGEQAPDSPLDVAYPTMFYPNATDADEATPFALRGGEHTELNMTLNPQHAMRLRIPIPRVEGANFQVSLNQSIFGQPEPAMSFGVHTNQDGVVEMDGVLPGRYEVTVSQFGAPNSGPTTHFTAEVAAGAATLSEAEAVEEVTVTGKVSGIEGKMVNAGISLYSHHPMRSFYGLLNGSGEFSIKVPPGEYEVVGQLGRMYLARVGAANAALHGRVLEVKSGASPQLAIVAGKGYGQIDGFVTSGSRRPGGVVVVLAPEDATNNQVLFRQDQSDSDGSFTLYNIVPGRYRLMAIDRGWDLDWGAPNVLGRFTKKSIPIQVYEEDKIKQLVEVQPK